jgi:hypothetical protein
MPATLSTVSPWRTRNSRIVNQRTSNCIQLPGYDTRMVVWCAACEGMWCGIAGWTVVGRRKSHENLKANFSDL